jgi:hypothetical protein
MKNFLFQIRAGYKDEQDKEKIKVVIDLPSGANIRRDKG